ncbi:putative membrane protein [Paenibacillus sp. V4I9]|nr:putative membrane protein [Paenibacillus sp. V4I9]
MIIIFTGKYKQIMRRFQMSIFWISIINSAFILLITELYLKKSIRLRWKNQLLALFSAVTVIELAVITQL